MSKSQIFARRSVMIGWDAVSWLLALGGFLLVRHEFSLSERTWVIAWIYFVAAIALQAIGGFATHLYLGRSKVGSFDEVTSLGLLVIAISVSLGATFFIAAPLFSRGIAFVMPAIAFLIMAAGRWIFRVARHEDRRRSGAMSGLPAIIYGANDAGHQLAGLHQSANDAAQRLEGGHDHAVVVEVCREACLLVRQFLLVGPLTTRSVSADQKAWTISSLSSSAPSVARLTRPRSSPTTHPSPETS